VKENCTEPVCCGEERDEQCVRPSSSLQESNLNRFSGNFLSSFLFSPQTKDNNFYVSSGKCGAAFPWLHRPQFRNTATILRI